MARILLVEDDEIMRVTLFDRMRALGFDVDQATDGRAALAKIGANGYDLVISDIKMPGFDGKKLMAEIRRSEPETDVILMTAYGSVEDAVDCLRKGAADYILKPFDMDDLTIRVNRLLSARKIRTRCRTLEEDSRPARIIGSSPVMQELQHLLARIAEADSSVLITGESGTGKELAAAAVHFQSRRSRGPYVRINCGAIPENLIESEFFGHEKGSFTGAVARKTGRFELADGGTLLLDEIGDLPVNLQVKLLRVLEEREFERVGGTRPIKIDVRIICATAKDLAGAVKQGEFREDLFYRLQVIPVHLPPLRERREDIPELCEHFLKEFGVMRGMTLELSEKAMRCLTSYRFPGNVRELRNIIERASVLTRSPLIDVLELPADLAGAQPRREGQAIMPLSEAVKQAEHDCISGALRHCGGNRTRAAELLGISRKNLWEKMKGHRMEG